MDSVSSTPKHEQVAPDDHVCRVVRQLCVAYQWALLSEDELVARVRHAASRDPGATLEYHTRDQYSRALWAACGGSDHEHKARAYAELQRFLYRAAYNRRPELADDAVQRALELVLRQHARCREPGAFLTFALNKLRQALREESDRADAASASDIPADTAAPDATPEQQEQRELVEALVGALSRLPDERQRQVVVRKFVDGARDDVIAAQLQITPNLVRVLRNRGLHRMREDVGLRAFFADDRA
jgi:RNA polymerase sigma factor (sigma-70 family)